MRKIIFLIVFTLIQGCNNPQKTTVALSKYKRDTIAKNVPRKEPVKTVTVENDSLFFIKGMPLVVNSINSYWEYEIKRRNQKMYIHNQKLRSVTSNFVLFETKNEANNSNNILEKKEVDYISKHQIHNLECEDVNDDGYCDFKILTERAAAGANETYEVFLFNPKNKQFEYSKIFSGTNVEYDKEKNRISFMWKMGAGMYSFGYVNLTKNKKDIAFIEDIQQDQDTIVYRKIIGKKIIKRKKIVLKREAGQGDDVNSGDIEYLLERNNK